MLNLLQDLGLYSDMEKWHLTSVQDTATAITTVPEERHPHTNDTSQDIISHPTDTTLAILKHWGLFPLQSVSSDLPSCIWGHHYNLNFNSMRMWVMDPLKVLLMLHEGWSLCVYSKAGFLFWLNLWITREAQRHMNMSGLIAKWAA